MRTYIDHLKEKPDHIKNHIALGLSSIVTFFIFIFWLSTQHIFLTPKNDIVKKETPSMTASVIDAFKIGFGNEKKYVAPDLEVIPDKK